MLNSGRRNSHLALSFTAAAQQLIPTSSMHGHPSRPPPQRPPFSIRIISNPSTSSPFSIALSLLLSVPLSVLAKVGCGVCCSRGFCYSWVTVPPLKLWHSFPGRLKVSITGHTPLISLGTTAVAVCGARESRLADERFCAAALFQISEGLLAQLQRSRPGSQIRP